MTAEQSLPASVLLARKGAATPLGLRRPHVVAGEDAAPEDTETAAIETGATEKSEPKPIQLELVSAPGDGEAGAASAEPPPPASLLPFSLRREHPEPGDAWELVSPDLLARMAGVAQEAADVEAEQKTTEKYDVESSPAIPGASQPTSESKAPAALTDLTLSPESPLLAEVREVAEATVGAPDSGEARATLGPEAAFGSESAPAEGRESTPDAQAPADGFEDDRPAKPIAEAAARAPALPATDEPVARVTARVTGQPQPETTAPVADPSWRIGVDKLPRAPFWAQSPEARRPLVMGALACLAIAGIAWWSFSSQEADPVAPPPAEIAEAAPGVTASPSPDMRTEIESPTQSGRDSPAGGTGTDAPPVAAKAPEPQSAPSGSPASSGPAAQQDAALPSAPSVDLVRIEPNGDAVIAGRAAPNSELILLDNGEPIGTVKADEFGEWVFVPDQPLDEGGHEFGLVLKSVEGTVTVPAETEPKEPAAPARPQIQPQAQPDDAARAAPGQAVPTTKGGDTPQAEGGRARVPLPARKPSAASDEAGLGVPIPPRKPATGQSQSSTSKPATGSSGTFNDFVVQLASVKTRAGARQEWKKLQSRFPETLEGMSLNLHEAKLSQSGSVVRVQTGPFSGLGEARKFCARMRAENQECLVLRTQAQKLTVTESRTQ